MFNIARGQVLAGAGDVFLTDPSRHDAVLRDPAALAFALFSTQTGDRVQVFPTTPGEHQTVNLVDHRLGLGHFFAACTVPADAPTGAGEMRWYYTMPSGAAGEIAVPLEILATPSLHPAGYCLLSDLRAEGLLAPSAPDARALRAIALAKAYVERVTERWFEPRYCTFEVDGEGDAMLELPAPIIAIESVRISAAADFANAAALDPASYRVYARHITDGATRPDDRSNPKLQMLGCSGRWPRGRQNLQVKGVFGYTDYDGSPTGQTPYLVRQASIALAMRSSEKLATRAQVSGPIVSEKTRDQSVDYADPGLRGAWTGDSELDLMLESFRRPPTFAVA
jgi:hypothetical protein